MWEQARSPIEQTLVVLYRETMTLPSEFSVVAAADETELQSALGEARNRGVRLLFVLPFSELATTLELLRERAGKGAGIRFGVVVTTTEPERCWKEVNEVPEVLDVLSQSSDASIQASALRRSARYLALAEYRAGLSRSVRTLDQLNRVFVQLSKIRDAQRLLAEILHQAIELSMAREGLLYVLGERDGAQAFRLRIVHRGRQELTIERVQQPIDDTSLCGHVALTGKPLNIADVRRHKVIGGPTFRRMEDLDAEAEPVGVLTIPLRNTQNQVLGVLQLVNKRRDFGVVGETAQAFDGDDESVISSFAAQAAICLENAELYSDIRRLFEGFVKAAIAAIESRDPSTGGHSERVAKLSVSLAKATTEIETGVYRSVRFRDEEIRELEYASLLHDFGKIGVREEVLVKAKKLYPFQLEAIRERVRNAKAAARIAVLEQRLRGALDEDGARKLLEEHSARLDSYWTSICEANEPTVLKQEGRKRLERIRKERFIASDGTETELLTEAEFEALNVPRGSLTEGERLEVESHVKHTYQFLKMIPWTREFRNLPEIAYAHHEKLDGTGYPRGLLAHEIPIQAKIMTIADIYDALTAADRWYKEAVPVPRALDILRDEVKQGKLDPVLLDIFIERKIYEITAPKVLGKVA
jgi:HD-GYP domain-containing protein (c-di-GMP phosphodiesterase class II)